MELYVGGNSHSVQGERYDLAGQRCFSAVHRVYPLSEYRPRILLDSGAFSDSPEKRLTPEDALQRQLDWEAHACAMWGTPIISEALVSYDLLIDETWVAGERHKRRWGIRQAEIAVATTVEAAYYLASQRAQLAPRHLVLSAQGVDAIQYAECTEEILKAAQPGDWFGMGGWCILGRFTRMMPEFWRTCQVILPKLAAAGVNRVHIFGVLYLPALGGLQWLADRHGIEVSTDSTAPVISCTRGDLVKAGARHAYWRDNVAWWQRTLAEIRQSAFYREPPAPTVSRQMELF